MRAIPASPAAHDRSWTSLDGSKCMVTSSARRPRSGSSAHSSAPDRNSVALHSNLRRARLATPCELDRRRCSNDDIPHDHLRNGYDAVRLPPVALIRSPARCPHSALSSAFAIPWRRYMGRGAIIVSFIVCYALTSVVGGYVSGSLYSCSHGETWIRTMILTASLFPGVCFVITMVLNFVAFMYRSLAAVPFSSVVAVLLIWAFIAFPLCIVGTILGRNWSGSVEHPCRINAIPRLIPDKRWYATPPVLIGLGGVLPFGSIFIEMYFVFTSFWNYKFYYVYGFMLLVYIILTIVTVCVTIVVTYFLLNNEDYRWPWTSFCASASTARPPIRTLRHATERYLTPSLLARRRAMCSCTR